MISNRIRVLSTGLVFSLSNASAFAAGYEKTLLWSGKFTGVAGAANSWVSGPESLFFNPAGLAAGESLQVTGNFSPTWAKFSGPFTSSTPVDGVTTFSPIASAIASYKLTPQLGVGLGYFVSGGANSAYEEIDFGSNFTFKPNSKTNIKITELSAGAGYEVIEGMRIGAAYRIAFVSADIDSAQRGFFPSTAPGGLSGQDLNLVEIRLRNLTTTRYNGFRFGLQYAPKDAGFGVGASLRTPIKFIAKGKSSGRGQGTTAGGTAAAVATAAGVNATVRDFTERSAELESEFPLQVSLGAFVDLMDKKLRISPEYTFTNYAVDRTANVFASVGDAAGAVPTSRLNADGSYTVPNFQQGWRNQHNIRLGGQYMITDATAVRAGYVLTTQVTPPENARPTFASPGLGHSYTLGAGTTFLENRMSVDGAFEYSRASGAGTNPEGVKGEFNSKGYAIHAGVTYTL